MPAGSGEPYKVRVIGLKELDYALRRVSVGTDKAMRTGLIEAAQPVAADARGRLQRFQGISLGSIVPRAAYNGVFITQKRGKKTGKRPDFGALQMRDGLLPAAEAGYELFRVRVDESIGRLFHLEGF